MPARIFAPDEHRQLERIDERQLRQVARSGQSGRALAAVSCGMSAGWRVAAIENRRGISAGCRSFSFLRTGYRGRSGTRTLAQPSALFLDRFRLLLAFPVVELGAWTAEHDPFPRHAACAHLPRIEVLDDVRRDQRGEHEDADGRVRVVADLVRALLAARERDDVALAQLLLALVRAQRRLAAEDDRPFLVRVVGVK